LDRYAQFSSDLEESALLLDMAIEESDDETLQEASEQLETLKSGLRQFSLDIMLDGRDDQNNAIVSINAGAGGTEAQDWTEMLFRMYSRWTERKGYKFDIIDYQPGDEAGIKSVTFTAAGEYAYGYLKTENGVHRLVRISPFNANGKRHTSFSSVFVYPELANEIVIEIDSQIRSYILHPYQMVKDHRINLDIGNVNSVLDGGIDPFIEAVLRNKN